MGRQTQRYKNPPIKHLFQRVWTYQVDYDKWVSDLNDILEHTRIWNLNVPMWPQIQVKRLIGLPNDDPNSRIEIA